MMQMSAKALGELSGRAGDTQPASKKKDAGAHGATIDFSVLLGMQSLIQPAGAIGPTVGKTAVNERTVKPADGSSVTTQTGAAHAFAALKETAVGAGRAQIGAGNHSGLLRQSGTETDKGSARGAESDKVAMAHTTKRAAMVSPNTIATTTGVSGAAKTSSATGGESAATTAQHHVVRQVHTQQAVPTNAAVQTEQLGIVNAVKILTPSQPKRFVPTIAVTQTPRVNAVGTSLLTGSAPGQAPMALGSEISRTHMSTFSSSQSTLKRMPVKVDGASEMPQTRNAASGKDGNSSVNAYLPIAVVHSVTPSPVQSTVTPANAAVQTSHTVNLNDAGAQQKLGGILVNQIQTGPNQVQVKVHPEGMGDIVVSVVRNQDGIHVKLEANQMQTTQWLAEQSQQLTNVVRATGIDIHRVEVSFGTANFSNQSGNDQSSSRRQRQEVSAAKVWGVTGKTANNAWDSQLQDDLTATGISLRV